MASVWKHVASAASALCDNRIYTSITENRLKEQVLQQQSALEELRNLLNHEQMITQELRAQLKDERRRAQLSSPEQPNARRTEAALLQALLADRMRLGDQLQEMKSKFQAQGSELEQAHVELEKVKADLHEKHLLNASRDSEKELLGALMERVSHLVMAGEAESERSDQKLPQELDVVQAQKPVKEWQSAKTELPIQIAAREAAELRQELQDLQHKLEHEEAVNKLQHASFIRLYNRHTAFEAEVRHFLQKLGQRHPDLASDFASACRDAHAS